MIRTATIEDLPLMEAGAREFYASSQYLKTFDPARFCALWKTLIGNNSGAIFMLFRDGTKELIGALGAVVYPDSYSADLIATEFFWYVLEGKRGHGLELYDAYEKWAQGKGCNRIRMAHLCDLMPDGLKWLYEEMGFDAVEITYEKELPR